MKIIWSELAKDYYLLIIEQLFEKWNFSIVEKFETETVELISKIAHHNHICPKSKIENFHICVVNKHISLIYRIENKNLEIITFLFNQSDHLF
ncbi:type II toxin-antitoxin system RelE/ParE family toxin [Flavobacterium azooxidireducens]|uniref:Type II toxin-antitoxin system RelE/ParE family toxin n=1 Tax=Flavobacterium azooxidireducens TaxID=1871076 RepID=A0ABY4KGX3_9FLAO|nr:type II toxin-antitoxin system RelE/ParE family toxin [Flavobacterium azooxidireducens]UPQ80060.1 type II toxin-antitoxin system RelE/ParE family toxin [Flavobacterium azooxidireducens]